MPLLSILSKITPAAASVAPRARRGRGQCRARAASSRRRSPQLRSSSTRGSTRRSDQPLPVSLALAARQPGECGWRRGRSAMPKHDPRWHEARCQGRALPMSRLPPHLTHSLTESATPGSAERAYLWPVPKKSAQLEFGPGGQRHGYRHAQKNKTGKGRHEGGAHASSEYRPSTFIR